jgi:multidrug transporter EmrE-like cation transporter
MISNSFNRNDKKKKHLLLILCIIFFAAILEGLAVSCIKYAYIHKNKWYITISIILFTIISFLFYYVYHFEKISIVNAHYNVFSFLIITIIGVYIFKETLSICEKLGLSLILFGIMFIMYEEIGMCF